MEFEEFEDLSDAQYYELLRRKERADRLFFVFLGLFFALGFLVNGVRNLYSPERPAAVAPLESPEHTATSP